MQVCILINAPSSKHACRWMHFLLDRSVIISALQHAMQLKQVSFKSYLQVLFVGENSFPRCAAIYALRLVLRPESLGTRLGMHGGCYLEWTRLARLEIGERAQRMPERGVNISRKDPWARLVAIHSKYQEAELSRARFRYTGSRRGAMPPTSTAELISDECSQGSAWAWQPSLSS